MCNPKCGFLRLLGRHVIDEEIVIRTDSIVEVWTSGRHVTIVYKHPTENRLIEHEEVFDDFGYVRQRFWMIMKILGAEYQIERINELRLEQHLKGGD